MRPITVHALAVAARRADVAGVVRLSCLADVLEVELVRVTAFASGFAPAGLADPVTFRVPYTAVRGLVREGRILYLALDPALVRPYARFALARFTDEPDEALAHAHEARARERLASLLLPIPAGAVAALAISAELARGPIGRLSVGALVALAVWASLRGMAALRAWGGPRSDRLRDRFEAALSERLALVPMHDAATRASRVVPVSAPIHVPAPVHVHAPVHVPEPLPPRPAAIVALPGPSREAPPSLWRSPVVAMAAAAIGVVIVVGFLRRYAAERTPPRAVALARAGLAAAARSGHADVPPPPQPESCLCARADSPLWKDGVPVLSVLTFEGDEAPTAAPEPVLDGKGFPQYRFDLAIVNNGARSLRDVRLTLTFARRNAAGKRVGAVDRGLFWEGVLSPGHAAKWHVKAPGGEVRTDLSVTGTLEKAHIDPAPADAFFALGSARVRAVRVHGAVMLAYLRDPRADAAARALATSGAADEIVLARVRRAAANVIACDLHREGERLDACLWNGATQPKRGLSLREVPAVPGAEARTVPLDVTLPVHEGVRVHLDVPGDFAPELAIVDSSSVD